MPLGPPAPKFDDVRPIRAIGGSMILNRRTSRFRNRLGLVALAALALLAAGCGDERPVVSEVDDGTPRHGGTAVLGSISDVDSWNEYTSQQSFAGNLLRRIYLRLAQDHGRGIGDPTNFGPLLAESWEPSEDGLSLTFALREARWSDGHPLTANDVRFTWLAQTHDDVPWIGVTSKSRITDVEVLGPRRVRFHFDTKYPYQLADAVLAVILSSITVSASEPLPVKMTSRLPTLSKPLLSGGPVPSKIIPPD